MALKNKAFSMIELLIAICVFGLAILPIVWSSSNQAKNAYSVGKHMMAGQLAASFLDDALKGTYSECLEKIDTLSGTRKKINNNDNIQNLENIFGEASSQGDVQNDMEVAFKNFSYEYEIKEVDSTNKIIRIDVTVYYHLVEGNPKTEQSIKLSALKFGDKNG